MDNLIERWIEGDGKAAEELYERYLFRVREFGIVAVLAWSVARESARRRRWREAERLSRCLFAAAGLRKYR